MEWLERSGWRHIYCGTLLHGGLEDEEGEGWCVCFVEERCEVGVLVECVVVDFVCGLLRRGDTGYTCCGV